MASFVFVHGASKIGDGTAGWSTATGIYKARLAGGALPASTITSLAAVTGIGNDATLSSLVVTKEEGSTRVLFASGNPAWSSIATGSTITCVVFYKDAGGDSSHVPLAVHDVTDTPTNGGTIGLTLSSGIVFTLTC
jgi:hypothetical protein